MNKNKLLEKRITRLLKVVLKDFNLSFSVRLFVTNNTKEVETIIKKYKLKMHPRDADISATAVAFYRKTYHYFLFYNADFWEDASEEALMGNIAHELGHRELFELKLEEPPDYFKSESRITTITTEWLVDILAVAKGYGNQMVENSKYLCTKFKGKDPVGATLPALISLNAQIQNLDWDRLQKRNIERVLCIGLTFL